jgi:hypothetical protein
MRLFSSPDNPGPTKQRPGIPFGFGRARRLCRKGPPLSQVAKKCPDAGGGGTKGGTRPPATPNAGLLEPYVSKGRCSSKRPCAHRCRRHAAFPKVNDASGLLASPSLDKAGTGSPQEGKGGARGPRRRNRLIRRLCGADRRAILTLRSTGSEPARPKPDLGVPPFRALEARASSKIKSEAGDAGKGGPPRGGSSRAASSP